MKDKIDNRRLTSFRIDTDLFVKLKVVLAQENTTMQDYLTNLIEKDLKEREIKQKRG